MNTALVWSGWVLVAATVVLAVCAWVSYSTSLALIAIPCGLAAFIVVAAGLISRETDEL